MLISYPFLPKRAAGSDDDAYEQSILDLEMLYAGVYPSSYEREWHGGIHVQSNAWEPVRAIADGVLVAYRLNDDLIKERDEDATGCIDNSFVLLKHEMESDSANVNNTETPVKVVFYSLYMHLANNKEYLKSIVHSATGKRHAAIRQVGPDVQIDGKTNISRKDILGFPGQSYSNYNVIHFEIFTTEEALKNFFVNSKTASEIGTKGTWGDSYFIVKANTTAVPEHPLITKRKADYAAAHPPAAAGAHPHPGSHTPRPPDNTIGHHAFPSGSGGTSGDDGATCSTADKNLLIRIGFRKGAKFTTTWLDEGDGKAPTLLTSADGDKDVDYEYDLHAIASELYPGCPSAGYELLRFGKVIGPDSVVAEEKHNWQFVTYGVGQQGYIDLADASVQVLSDADFPYWLGWQKIEGGLFPESGQCDMPSMLDLLGVERDLGGIKPDPSGSGSGALSIAQDVDDNQVASQELKSFFAIHPHVRDWAQRLVCKFPSEWDKGNNGRWVKLKQKDGLGPGKDGPFLNNDEEYNKHITFLEKLEWWTDAGLGDSNVWHFHPFRFIQQFKMCGWLSEDEFKRLYSDDHYRHAQKPSPSALRAKYLYPLNMAIRKYGLSMPVRKAHFLGQGAVESGWLAQMQETSMTGTLNATGLHGVAINPASQKQEEDLGHWYGDIPAEDDPWFRSTKFNSNGGRIAGTYDWKNGNCDSEDSQKFRGRGFKQLTGRSNYAQYWVFRGWIATSSFSSSWWNDPSFVSHHRQGMTKQPAQIDAPQRVALPENCIDSGGFYLRFERPNVAREIDRDSSFVAKSAEDIQKEHDISHAVTYAINGAYLDEDNRLKFTRDMKEILG